MKKIALLPLILVALTSCIREPEIDITANNILKQNFDFKSVIDININLLFKDSDDNPLSGVLVEIWDGIEGNGKMIFKSLTDINGEIDEALYLPGFVTKVRIEANYIGVPNTIWLPVLNGKIELEYLGEVNPDQLTEAPSSSPSTANITYDVPLGNINNEGITFNYLGGYNRFGVPHYLEPERDAISAKLLEYINASLPEKQPVPQYHPSFLAEGKNTTLDITETCDVWVTFVHEGAGFRNAIGFYTYESDTPPQSLDDINEVNVIFPNLSYAGSGGGLRTGDKVNIGRYEAGTSIGLVLMADGWDGSNSEDYYHIVFGDKSLNPEPNESLRQHNVLLWDEENELFLIGFEDILRDNRPFTCDNDFNDAILFVTSNPVEAISTVNVSPIDKPGTLDSDGDGVNDILDEYPEDATRAYDSFYPSATTYGTFAFEDNWPDYGDYDFNDLVIDYQFRHCLNAENKVVQIVPKFKIRAIGAGYRNGFGFATELAPSDIASVDGHSLNAGYTVMNGNGTEASQSNAVFIVSDNVHDHFDTGGFVNTEKDATYFEPQILELRINLSSPKTYAEIGAVPYNPFVIISQNRGREVHLPGYAPTDLVDQGYFKSLDDDTDLSEGIYYRSKTDLPWGIHLPESFDYPKEKADIRQGHVRFTDWARSFGYSYMDWYRDVNGYRSTSHLYKK